MTAPTSEHPLAFNMLGKRLLPVFVGKIFPVLVLAVIMVLYSRKLSFEAYGQFQAVWVYCNVLGVVTSFGISSVILSTRFGDLTRFVALNRRAVAALYAAGSLFTLAIFFFTATQLGSATRILVSLFVLAQACTSLLDSLLIKHNYGKTYLFINLAYTLGFLAVHLYFFLHPFVLEQLVGCTLLLSAAKALPLFIVRWPHQQPAEATIDFRSHWIFLGLNEVAGVIARWLDKIFLVYLLSPAAFAVFFNGAFEIPLFGILISALENILLTSISADTANKVAAKSFFRESFRMLSLISFPLFFFLLSMHAELFSILFKGKYNASIPVFLISIWVIPLRITHYGVILQCYGQSRRILEGSLLDLVLSLLLMTALFPVIGTPGVALAIVLSTYLQAGYYLWHSARTIGVTIAQFVPFPYLLKLAAGLLVPYTVMFLIKDELSAWQALLAASCLTLAVSGCGILYYWRRGQSRGTVGWWSSAG